MTSDEKLRALRAMNEFDDKDAVLLAYLDQAGAAIIARRFPYDETVTEVPARYEQRQIEIATYLLNKRGAEGQVSHSENGVSRTYGGASIPEDMLEDIVPMTGVV